MEGEQPVVDLLRRSVQRADVAELIQGRVEPARPRPVAAQPDHHGVGVMPQQLNRRKRAHPHLQHLTGPGQLIPEAPSRDPGQHELDHHQHRDHQRAGPQRG